MAIDFGGACVTEGYNADVLKLLRRPRRGMPAQNSSEVFADNMLNIVDTAGTKLLKECSKALCMETGSEIIIHDARSCVKRVSDFLSSNTSGRRIWMRERGEVFQRLDDLMKKSGRMEKELIEYIGLPAGTFSQWRRGNGDSYLRYIKEICSYFQVTPNYLFWGKEESEETLYTKEERYLVECYRKANEREKNFMKALAREIAK